MSELDQLKTARDRALKLCDEYASFPVSRRPLAAKTAEAFRAALAAPGPPEEVTTVRLVIENVAPLGPARTITLDGRRYDVVASIPNKDGMTETYELLPAAAEHEDVSAVRHERPTPAWCPAELAFGERGEHTHVCVHEVHDDDDHGCACGQSWGLDAPTEETDG